MWWWCEHVCTGGSDVNMYDACVGGSIMSMHDVCADGGVVSMYVQVVVM